MAARIALTPQRMVDRVERDIRSTNRTPSWPSDWESARSRRRPFAAVAALLSALLIVSGAVDIAQRNNLRGTFTLASAGFLTVGILAGYLSRIAPIGRRNLAIGVRDLPDRALYVPLSRFFSHTYTLLYLLGVCYFSALPVLAHAVSPDAPSRFYSRFLALTEIAPAFAALCAVFLVARIVRWRRPLGLALSPEGVYHWSWFGCRFRPWEKIHVIRSRERRGPIIELFPHEDGSERDPADSWLCRFGLFRDYMSRINAGYLAVNPALAFYALRFYHVHPELRDELSTDAGVQRLRRADFPKLLDKGWGVAREQST